MNLDNLPEEVKNYIRKLEQMRTDFVANVSHELRTPLTIIQGYVEWMLKQQNTLENTNTLQIIHHHSNRMWHLLEDLLLLSRLEDHSVVVDEEIVDVPSLLDKIREEALQLGSYKNHQISIEADSALALLGSERELKSLFNNLIYNAVKYTPANGNIRILWYKENQRAFFKVIDNGIGIAKKHIPRLTERFYRVDKARSRENGGTGLGLAIAKHVLLHHQAELSISSIYRKGSIFCCQFPATRVRDYSRRT